MKVTREKEEPQAFLSIIIVVEFSQKRKAENDNFVYVHVYVHVYAHGSVFTVDGQINTALKRILTFRRLTHNYTISITFMCLQLQKRLDNHNFNT